MRITHDKHFLNADHVISHINGLRRPCSIALGRFVNSLLIEKWEHYYRYVPCIYYIKYLFIY